jgi:hypothetical protein
MAPEIKNKIPYDGELSDVFSSGVILFILSQGIYPFKEACLTDPYFRVLSEGNYDDYWNKV